VVPPPALRRNKVSKDSVWAFDKVEVEAAFAGSGAASA